MSRVLWVGRIDDPDQLERLFAESGLQLVPVPDSTAAVSAAQSVTVPVAFVHLDDPGGAQTIARLAEVRPDLRVIGVTERPVPPHIVLALQAGVQDLVNLRLDGMEEVTARARAALRRHLVDLEELEFLRQLQELNDEFLRQTVALEKRNIELEEQLRQAGQIEGDAYRILVVDDEPHICELIAMLLEGKGYVIETASDAETGLALFQQEPFHLVVTDKNLPGMSGVELLRRVKDIRPRTDVVVITGFGSKESAIQALNQGAAAYLEKPFDDVTTVEGTLEVLIQRQQLQIRQRSYLEIIKERNRQFLDRYAEIRDRLKERLQGPVPKR